MSIAQSNQQPNWNSWHSSPVKDILSSCPPLAQINDILKLRQQLKLLYRGEYQLIQAGDCAESFEEMTFSQTIRKAKSIVNLSNYLEKKTGIPTISVGRIGGQFAKPRSNFTEVINGKMIPSFRGEAVNYVEADTELRLPDPKLMLKGYDAASVVFDALGWSKQGQSSKVIQIPVWTSHEALLLDYEVPQIRLDKYNRYYLSSTHWPWIGERTRHPSGQHVGLLSEVINPVGCKIGPDTNADEILKLCDTLDPDYEPGRLTVITRMGPDLEKVLPNLIKAVKRSGHPIIWICDPMHGNTSKTPDGTKVRFLENIKKEAELFIKILRSNGIYPAGLHLETTPNYVSECISINDDMKKVSTNYTTTCDPRLTVDQAKTILDVWTEALT